MIILSELNVKNIYCHKSIENHICSYNKVEFGKHIHLSNISFHDHASSMVELDRMKGNEVMIVVKLDEIKHRFENQIVAIPSQPRPAKKNTNRWRHSSGYAMICRAFITMRDQNKIVWNEEDYNLLKSVKNLFVGNSNTPHFCAQGKYFSFGVNALYKIDKNKSSIGKHSN